MVMSINLSKEEKITILDEIKKKKILRDLEDHFVLELLDDYLVKHPKLIVKLKEKGSFQKSKEFKLIVKDVRSVLHDVYGLFSFDKKKVEKLLKEKEFDLDWHVKVLKCSKSTSERLNYYPIIYEQIWSEIGEIKSILDLGCGLNPFSLLYMDLKNVEYSAYELTSGYCDVINKYFKLAKVNGKCESVDLLKIKKLPKADVCFLFKVLDGLEQIKLNYTLELFEKISSKFIIVSFATRSINAGKKFNRGKWFIRMLDKMKLKYKFFETDNEIFYIINK